MSDITEAVRPKLSGDEIRAELNRLESDVPWTHHFEIGGIETISSEQNDKFYKKSVAAKKIGDLAAFYCRMLCAKRRIEGTRVLDIASAEGGHSIAFARAGASEVIGVEGRQLYVDRAQFVARALDVPNVKFIRGDVRKLDARELGQFDFVICSGILHHLGTDDFLPFLQAVASVTADTLFLYTHVSNSDSVRDFRLVGPHDIGPGLTGYLYREHADEATAEERAKQVRASIDNTFSFWATEETLVRALSQVGFKLITKVFEPHAFGSYANRNIRVIFIAKKGEESQ